MPGSTRALLSALPLLLPVAQAAAQPVRAMRCDGLRISAIEIEQSERPGLDSVPAIVRPAFQFAMQGRTTREEAIRPFLLVEEGRRCTTRRMRETERVLRAQPYLADARVVAEPDGAGGVRLRVQTVDDIRLLVGGRFADGRVSGLRYGSTNLDGRGARAVAEWREGFAYRDGARLELMLAHTAGRPHRFTAAGERTILDERAQFAWERPFYSGLQRTGWYLGTDVVDGNARLLRAFDRPLALPYRARRIDLGGVVRLGGERLGIFAGPFLTTQRFETAGPARRVGVAGFEADADSAISSRYEDFEGARASVVVGGRWLSFVRAEGLDAREGPQDIGRGVQVAALNGVGLGADAGAAYYGGDLFLGAGGPDSYIALRGSWEERRVDGGRSDRLISGRLRWYARTSERGLWTLSAEFAGGWDQRRPFQFVLGDRDVGVRGLEESAAVGAQRAVARGEYRFRIGGISRHVSLATAAFGDVGLTTAGDVPFGVTTDPQASLGAALLVALPRQSRQIWRLEAARPFGAMSADRWVWRIGASSPWREFWRDPRDVAAMRALIPPATLFGFP